jgi:hypothetical protein
MDEIYVLTINLLYFEESAAHENYVLTNNTFMYLTKM